MVTIVSFIIYYVHSFEAGSQGYNVKIFIFSKQFIYFCNKFIHPNNLVNMNPTELQI